MGKGGFGGMGGRVGGEGEVVFQVVFVCRDVEILGSDLCVFVVLSISFLDAPFKFKFKCIVCAGFVELAFCC